MTIPNPFHLKTTIPPNIFLPHIIMRAFALALAPLLLAATASAADKWSMVGSRNSDCHDAIGSKRGDDHGYGCQQLLDQTANGFQLDGDAYTFEFFKDKTCHDGLVSQKGSGCMTVDPEARFNSYRVNANYPSR